MSASPAVRDAQPLARTPDKPGALPPKLMLKITPELYLAVIVLATTSG